MSYNMGTKRSSDFISTNGYRADNKTRGINIIFLNSILSKTVSLFVNGNFLLPNNAFFYNLSIYSFGNLRNKA